MTRFLADAPKTEVVKAFELLGFSLVREREHIAITYFSYPLSSIFHKPDKRFAALSTRKDAFRFFIAK